MACASGQTASTSFRPTATWPSLTANLHLLDPTAPRGQRLPIDFFFRSLAQDQRERAIGIVLSGTGSDGTLGVRDIKGEGGMVMAQSPESTEFDGMPRSAIATGLVDYALPPAAMLTQLATYVEHAFRRQQDTATTLDGMTRGNAEEDFCGAPAFPDRPRFLAIQAEHH
jgi:two-component system CheB/CheR fusion protein